MTQLIDYLSEKYQPEAIDKVNRRLVELSSLFEISQLLNESLELDRVLNNVLLIPMGRLMLPRCAIVLKVDEAYETVMSKGISAELKEKKFNADTFDENTFVVHQAGTTSETPLPDDFLEFVTAANLKIAVPFIFKNEPLGFLLFGAKLNKSDFTSEEIDFLNSLANLSAPMIQNALQVNHIRTINNQLAQRIQELRSLFDITQGLSSVLEKDEIIRLLMLELTGQMFITRYAILDRKGDSLKVFKRRGFKEDMCHQLCEHLSAMPAPAATCLAADLEDTEIAGRLTENQVEVVIPMRHQDNHLGYVMLGNKMNQQAFSENDLEFMTTLVGQAAVSLENARLFKESLEKQRLEEELNVARNIQKKLLPKSIPDLENYEIYGMNDSSLAVGGDYYDVIPIDDDRVALAIGDVSGKGIPASLLMANLQSALRVSMTPDLNLPNVVSKLNDLIYNNTGLDKFITFFIGILNFKEHTFEYVNAGHNNPIFYTADNQMNFLDVGGIILGVMPNRPYETATINLAKDDLVLTYTDGVNEAIDINDEEWGEEPMYEIVKNNSRAPVKDIVNKLLDGIEEFSAGAQQADDITMLALRRIS